MKSEVLKVRVGIELADAIRNRAKIEGSNLSEICRNILMRGVKNVPQVDEVVVPQGTDEDEWVGIDEEKAERMRISNMSPVEKLQLAKDNFAGHYDFDVSSLMKPQIEFIKQHLEVIANDTYEYPD